MIKYVNTEHDIFAMANVRGSQAVVPAKLPFSFFFSANDGSPHSIRVKLSPNREKLKRSQTNVLKLSDDWEYIITNPDYQLNAKQLSEAKKYFHKYIVLFCAVWDEQMQEGVLEDYIMGRVNFNQMIQDLDFYEEYQTELDSISNVEDLEEFCRVHELVNLYGN